MTRRGFGASAEQPAPVANVITITKSGQSMEMERM
jgi:hypothetical protein